MILISTPSSASFFFHSWLSWEVSPGPVGAHAPHALLTSIPPNPCFYVRREQIFPEATSTVSGWYREPIRLETRLPRVDGEDRRSFHACLSFTFLTGCGPHLFSAGCGDFYACPCVRPFFFVSLFHLASAWLMNFFL